MADSPRATIGNPIPICWRGRKPKVEEEEVEEVTPRPTHRYAMMCCATFGRSGCVRVYQNRLTALSGFTGVVCLSSAFLSLLVLLSLSLPPSCAHVPTLLAAVAGNNEAHRTARGTSARGERQGLNPQRSQPQGSQPQGSQPQGVTGHARKGASKSGCKVVIWPGPVDKMASSNRRG